MGLSAATIYMNPAAEVRRAQTKRFRNGLANLVIATDALSVGLNMRISRFVMTTAVKLNDVE